MLEWEWVTKMTELLNLTRFGIDMIGLLNI